MSGCFLPEVTSWGHLPAHTYLPSCLVEWWVYPGWLTGRWWRCWGWWAVCWAPGRSSPPSWPGRPAHTHTGRGSSGVAVSPVWLHWWDGRYREGNTRVDWSWRCPWCRCCACYTWLCLAGIVDGAEVTPRTALLSSHFTPRPSHAALLKICKPELRAHWRHSGLHSHSQHGETCVLRSWPGGRYTLRGIFSTPRL